MSTTIANYGEWDVLYVNALLEPIVVGCLSGWRARSACTGAAFSELSLFASAFRRWLIAASAAMGGRCVFYDAEEQARSGMRCGFYAC